MKYRALCLFALAAAAPAHADRTPAAGRPLAMAAAPISGIRLDRVSRALYLTSTVQAQLSMSTGEIARLAGMIRAKDRQIQNLNRASQAASHDAAAYRRTVRELQALLSQRDALTRDVLARLARQSEESALQQVAFRSSFASSYQASDSMERALTAYYLGEPGSREALTALAQVEAAAEHRLGEIRERARNGQRMRHIAYAVLDGLWTGTESLDGARIAFEEAVAAGDDASLDTMLELTRLQIASGQFAAAAKSIASARRIDAVARLHQPIAVANAELDLLRWTGTSEDYAAVLESMERWHARKVAPGPGPVVVGIFAPAGDAATGDYVAANDLAEFDTRRSFPPISSLGNDGARLLNMMAELRSSQLVDDPDVSCLFRQFDRALVERSGGTPAVLSQTCPLPGRQTVQQFPPYKGQYLLVLELHLAVSLLAALTPTDDLPDADSNQGRTLERAVRAFEAELAATQAPNGTDPVEILLARSRGYQLASLYWKVRAGPTNMPELIARARRDASAGLASLGHLRALGATGTMVRSSALEAAMANIDLALDSGDLAGADRLAADAHRLFGRLDPLPGAQKSDELHRLAWTDYLSRTAIVRQLPQARTSTRDFLQVAHAISRIYPGDAFVVGKARIAAGRLFEISGERAAGIEAIQACDREGASDGPEWQSACSRMRQKLAGLPEGTPR